MIIAVTLIALFISKCSAGDCGKLNRGFEIDGQCIKLFLERATFCEAKTHCENGKGQLLSKDIAAGGLTEPFFRKFVKSYKTPIVYSKKQLWIGVHGGGPNETEWQTVRDEDATFADDIPHSQWKAITVYYDKTDKFEPIYKAIDPEKPRAFICEYPL